MLYLPTEKQSVPRVIINDTIHLFFKTAVSICWFLNHNSWFRVLSDKITSVSYILFEKYIYNLALETASPGNQHCAD